MCGLSAWSGKGNFDLDKMKLLLTYNSLERGKDAIGFYSPLNGLQKKAGLPVSLLPKMPIIEDNSFIGHVRASTVGGDVDKNAHPFKHNNLIGIMNGTLSNHWSLGRKNGFDAKDFDVDSDILFAMIAKDKSFKVLEDIQGGCAIIVADTEAPNTLYVYRNKERPLYRGNLNGGMYISSIEESLKIIGCETTKEFKEDFVYTIVDGAIKSQKMFKSKVPEITTPAIDLSGETHLDIYSKVTAKHFVFRWLYFKEVAHYSYWKDKVVGHLTDDKWYMCVDYVTNTKSALDYVVTVIDDNNNKFSVSYYAFEYRLSFPRSGSPLKILGDINGTGGVHLFKEGDIGILHSYEYSKKSSAMFINTKINEEDDTYWIFTPMDARPLSPTEEHEWKKKLALESNDNTATPSATNLISQRQFPFAFNEPEIGSETDIIPSGYNRNHDNYHNPLGDIDSETPVDVEIIDEVDEEECIMVDSKALGKFIDQLEYKLKDIHIQINDTVGMSKWDREDLQDKIININKLIDENVTNFLGNG